MNLIIIEQHEINDGTVTLSDQRCTHIRKVLRSREGDTVRLGLLNGPIGEGKILRLSRHRVDLELTLDRSPPPVPQTDLILALPRPIMLKRVLAQATQMGVRKIFLTNANRVEKSFFSASILKDDSLQSYLKQGLEQAVDTLLPEISIHNRFRPFIEDILPVALNENKTKGFVAHPTALNSLTQSCRPPLSGHVMLAIGPEGGWVDFEIEKFQEQGFTPFTIGPRILRVDTAVPALLAQISLMRTIS